MDNPTAHELIPQAIKRLTELYEKHGADISDDHANVLYWQIVAVVNYIVQDAGIPYDGPPLDSLRASTDFTDAQQPPAEYGASSKPNW